MARVRNYSVDFKKKKVAEWLKFKDQYKSMKEFCIAQELNDSTFGQWVTQYESMLDKNNIREVLFRDLIATFPPFSPVKIVPSNNTMATIFSGKKGDLDEEFIFLYGDRVVEMVIPSTETLIIFS